MGATLRYAFLVAFPVDAGAFPLTILVENVLGAFLLGLLGAVLVQRHPHAAALHAFVTTGVLGSFTTFSAVSMDLVGLGQGGRAGLALTYAAGSIVCGLSAALAGLALGRRIA